MAERPWILEVRPVCRAITGGGTVEVRRPDNNALWSRWDREMAEKKPCPWCGSENTASPPGVAIIVCGGCGACGPEATPHPTNDALTEIAARSKWNERPWEAGEK